MQYYNVMQFWAWEHVHVEDESFNLNYVGRPPPLMAYWNEINVNSWIKFDKKGALDIGKVSAKTSKLQYSLFTVNT